jgi:hypothetical protein
MCVCVRTYIYIYIYEFGTSQIVAGFFFLSFGGSGV